MVLSEKFSANNIDINTVRNELIRVCKEMLESVVVAPDVQIRNVSVEYLRTARFDNVQEKPIFIVSVHTNDSTMVRGDPNLYKGSYKERIEGTLDFYAKELIPSCEVHLDIYGPNKRSVERLISVAELMQAGRLSAESPIIETAHCFSMPDILIRGRHIIAPSPTVANYLELLLKTETISSALDLFGGTGLTAKAICSVGNPERVTVVERDPAHMERMRRHLSDERVKFVLGDAFEYKFSEYDLIVADPYYEDAIRFLDLRLGDIINSSRIFVFVPGKIEDLRWNNEVEQLLKRTGARVKRWQCFGQVLFDVRP